MIRCFVLGLIWETSEGHLCHASVNTPEPLELNMMIRNPILRGLDLVRLDLDLVDFVLEIF